MDLILLHLFSKKEPLKVESVDILCICFIWYRRGKLLISQPRQAWRHNMNIKINKLLTCRKAGEIEIYPGSNFLGAFEFFAFRSIRRVRAGLASLA